MTDRPLRILLAEDNPVNQRVAQLMLARLGHQVDTVGTGFAAVRAVRHTDYDLVLMDVQMPELDGVGATEIIRAELPSSRQPPIVAVTASVLAEDRAAWRPSGDGRVLDQADPAPGVGGRAAHLRRPPPHPRSRNGDGGGAGVNV